MRSPNDKIMDFDRAAAWRESLHQNGQKLVVTNGCFDILHRGHIEYLNKARRLGDALLVGINCDRSLTELKGPERPLIGEQDRAYLLASFEAIDAVVIFPNLRATNLFQAVPPDIYAKGGDYDLDSLDQEEYAVLRELGVEVAFIPFVSGYSTTGIIARIRAGVQDED